MVACSFRCQLQLALGFDSLVLVVRWLSKRSASTWPGETLGDDKGIVSQGLKEFTQHFGLFGMLRHALHFSL